MSIEQCYFLGLHELPGGNCAQWFSGTASAIAVCIALAGYFYTEWRHRKNNLRQDLEIMASVSSLLQTLVHQVGMNAIVMNRIQEIEFEDHPSIKLIPPTFGASAFHFSGLDGSQVRLFAHYNRISLASKLNEIQINYNTLASTFEEYCEDRKALSKKIHALERENYSSIREGENIDMLVEGTEYLSKEGFEILRDVLNLIEEFNEFVEDEKLFGPEFQVHHSDMTHVHRQLSAKRRGK